MRRTNLPGHALRSEGQSFEMVSAPAEDEPLVDWTTPDGRWWVRAQWGDGVALCECGWTSEVLESNGQRKKAHADHKLMVRLGRRCLTEAVAGGTVYPCTGDHADGCHHFAIDHPDPCPAPWCRLPAGHRSLHDIPSGKPEIRKATADA